MLKKFVSVVVGATLVLAAVGVSAAPTVGTTSTYEEDGLITVTTTVTNDDADVTGDVYTYMAYKLDSDNTLANITGDEIVFIDQKAPAGTVTTFEYVTDDANIGADILVGGKVDGLALAAQASTIPGVSVAYVVNVNGSADGNGTIAVTDITADDFIDISAPATLGLDITEVKVGDTSIDFFASATGIYVKGSNFIGATETVVFDITASANTAAVNTLNGGLDTENSTNNAIAIGEAFGNVKEYGIQFGADIDFTSARNFKAIAKGSDGKYAIKLMNYITCPELETATEKVYFRAYYVADDSEQPVYGETMAINVAQ